MYAAKPYQTSTLTLYELVPIVRGELPLRRFQLLNRDRRVIGKATVSMPSTLPLRADILKAEVADWLDLDTPYIYVIETLKISDVPLGKGYGSQFLDLLVRRLTAVHSEGALIMCNICPLSISDAPSDFQFEQLRRFYARNQFSAIDTHDYVFIRRVN